MKIKDLKAGQVYRLQSNYGLGDRVIVLDTESRWSKNSSWSARTVGRKTTGGQGIAVAKESGFGFGEDRKVYWTPSIVQASQIEAPEAEAIELDQKRKARELEERTRKAQADKARAERTADLNTRLEALFPDEYVSKIYDNGRGGYTVDAGRLAKLIALAEGNV